MNSEYTPDPAALARLRTEMDRADRMLRRLYGQQVRQAKVLNIQTAPRSARGLVRASRPNGGTAA